jgi:hypothetical protein
VTVNGQAMSPDLRDGYAVLRREWRPRDTVAIDFSMPVRWVIAHEAVEDDRGRVAIERGPIVYCIEGADHNGSVLDVYLPEETTLTAEHRSDLLGGVTVLLGSAKAAFRRDDGTVASKPVPITMIPYYAWCHRGPNEMVVWIPKSQELAKVPPPPTTASTSRASASHCWPPDSVDALNDQVEPKNSNDHSIPRHTWWDHRGTAEWVQYDFREPASVSAVEVYWFDDTGRGHCRVPKSWHLLYRDGDRWRPVQHAGDRSVEKDRFNRLEFSPVTTDGLRIEVQLQPEVSGGILEWRVVEALP